MDESLEKREPRVYEIGYHFLPILGNDKLSTEEEKLRKLIAKFGGLVIQEESAHMINLAYPIDKIIDNKRNTFSQGYFGWIKFDITPEEVEKLKEELDKLDSLLRYLLIKTVREDTLSQKRPQVEEKKPEVDEIVIVNKDETEDIEELSEKEKLDEEELEKQLEDIMSEDLTKDDDSNN